MKKTITSLLLFIAGYASFGQIKAELKIEGISPEIEANLLQGDMLSYFGDIAFHNNLIVEVYNDRQRKVFGQSIEIPRDESGHHQLSTSISIIESDWISLQGEFELYVYTNTILGNRIWTKTKRTLENASDPIILDHYNAGESEIAQPKSILPINISNQLGSSKADKEIKLLLSENGDNRTNLSKKDYRFMLKNEGQDNWVIDITGPPHTEYSTGHIKAAIPYTDQVDLSKSIVLRVEKTTQKGNLLWLEETITPRTLLKTRYPNNYALIEKDESTEEPEIEEDVTEETDTTQEDNNASNDNKEEEPPAADKPVVLGSSIATKPTKTGPQGATDLTTKTVIAKCTENTEGDSLITINGSSICLNGTKPAGSSANSGKLNFDCNLEINGVIFPLKAGEYVRYNRVKGTLMEGTLRADLAYEAKAGLVLLKAGTKVTFSGNKLASAFLADDASLTINDITIIAIAGQGEDPDIRFDNQGRLAGCTLKNAVEWKANQTVNLSENSRLVFKNGNLSQVFLGENGNVSIGNKTYKVSKDTRQPSFRFNSANDLDAFLAGSDNSVEIEGQTVSIENGSEVRLIAEAGTLAIERFVAGNEVTLKVYKGSKTKEVLVKKGKKIAFKAGKVVKAG